MRKIKLEDHYLHFVGLLYFDAESRKLHMVDWLAERTMFRLELVIMLLVLKFSPHLEISSSVNHSVSHGWIRHPLIVERYEGTLR